MVSRRLAAARGALLLALCASLALAGSGCFLLGAAAAPAIAASAAPPASPATAASDPAPADSTARASAAAPRAEHDALPPEVDIAPPQPGLPDLRKTIGGRGDGGTAPIALQALTQAMTPDDVEAVFPGARQVSKFGISTIKARNLPGVDTIEFIFLEGKLHSAMLNYRRNLMTAAFATYLRRVVANKYGESKDDIMTYALSDGVMVQVGKFVDHYQLSYTPPEH